MNGKRGNVIVTTKGHSGIAEAEEEQQPSTQGCTGEEGALRTHAFQSCLWRLPPQGKHSGAAPSNSCRSLQFNWLLGLPAPAKQLWPPFPLTLLRDLSGEAGDDHPSGCHLTPNLSHSMGWTKVMPWDGLRSCHHAGGMDKQENWIDCT